MGACGRRGRRTGFESRDRRDLRRSCAYFARTEVAAGIREHFGDHRFQQCFARGIQFRADPAARRILGVVFRIAPADGVYSGFFGTMGVYAASRFYLFLFPVFVSGHFASVPAFYGALARESQLKNSSY